jgi:hypothetical protein
MQTFHTLVVFAVLAVSRAQDAATATAGSGSGASAEAKLDFTIGVSNSATSNAVTFGNVANTFGNTFAGNANAVATSSTNLGTSNFVVGSTIGGTTSNSGKGGKGDAGAMALFGGGGAIKGGDGGGKGGKTDGKGGKGDGQLFKASGNEIDSKGGKGGKGKKGGASVGAMKQGTTHWSTFYCTYFLICKERRLDNLFTPGVYSCLAALSSWAELPLCLFRCAYCVGWTVLLLQQWTELKLQAFRLSVLSVLVCCL